MGIFQQLDFLIKIFTFNKYLMILFKMNLIQKLVNMVKGQDYHRLEIIEILSFKYGQN